MSLRGGEGTAGSFTSGGAGGSAGIGAGIFGSDQDYYTRISWDGFSGLVGQPFGAGLPSAGGGGSLVYLNANILHPTS